ETEYSSDDESVHDTIKNQFIQSIARRIQMMIAMWKEFPRLFLVIIPLFQIIVMEGWKSRSLKIRLVFYDLLKKHQLEGARESSPSLSHPPGFTPEVSEIQKENVHVQEESNRESASQNVGNNGGSVLGVLEDMIRVGQAMGYTMDGCIKDLEHIIGFFETCVMGLCFDLVMTLDGEAIIMGDFNEVRSEDERRGLVFNPSSARIFDHFISSSGLVDVKLKGYAFTWSHPSASKMSKLDQFLVSEEASHTHKIPPELPTESLETY
nr:RNA-directed DNA polymerase, eukaryota [Tanacetum cinerariifolium]